MAGEAVLSSFIQVLFEKVLTAGFNELGLIGGMDTELQGLSSTLSTIQSFIEDAEEKQLKDKSVRSWLGKLKDVAYDMDELLDGYAIENLQSKHKVKSCPFLCIPKGLYKYKIALEVRAIHEKLDKIAKERDALGLQMFGGTSHMEITERPKTSSLVDASNVFGREEDREKIVNMLLSPTNSSRVVSVLPIVGMGGLGKTTLAQLVYNDARIKQNFQLRMWVCVSEYFDEMKLTKETLESASVGNSSMVTNVNYSSSGYNSFVMTNMNLLQEDLCNQVKGKKFLLVLDDVWNEDPNKWYSYYSALASGERGSKVVVTTQNENVGRIMRGLLPYRLKELTDEDCWKLFKNYAFVNGDSSEYPNLEEIGREIVKKLKGLPLAAKALGSLLYSKVDEEDWMVISKSEIWELPPDRNNILPALRLSYKHLPPHLKQCLAFCSIFHKDYVFERDRLVQIWIGLGFVQPQGRRRLEDVGIDYFNDLLSRSFFQSHKGRYVMHDAIHDLAQSVSVDECLIMEDDRSGITLERIKHLSFSCDNSKPTSFNPFYKYKRVRTLLLLKGYKSSTDPIPSDLFYKLRYLRVLDLNRRDICELPDSIGNLKQLRYLNLSGTRITKLPSSISKLCSLQTLRLKNCDSLDEIPKGVTKLVNLRHLEANTRLMSKIARIGNLNRLQELEEFVVRKEKGYTIRELRAMTDLRGHLSIKELENVTSKIEASDASLSEKEYLSVLHLEWSDKRCVTLEEEHVEEQILETLKPNSRLKELTIKGFAGCNFPNWLNNPNSLQIIHLSDCKQSKTLPCLGQLPFLRYLDIGGLHSVTKISQEFTGNGGIPSLIELVLEDMPALEEWTFANGELFFPQLIDLQVLQCPKLLHLPKLPQSLSRLRISELGLTVLPEVCDSSSQYQSSLTHLQINDCPSLSSLEQGLLSQQLGSLKELTITDCEELVFLPTEGFKSLVSLKSLHIYNCPMLKPTRQEGNLLPHSLEELGIKLCCKLINPLLLELKTLSSLTHLSINECDELNFFPYEGLPFGLEYLGIFNCKNLLTLPDCLREVYSLRTLVVVDCPRIPCLPSTGLPGMLRELYIKECPLLTESCQENAVDWHKIAHVPIVDIDEEGILPGRRVNRRR